MTMGFSFRVDAITEANTILAKRDGFAQLLAHLQGVIDQLTSADELGLDVQTRARLRIRRDVFELALIHAGADPSIRAIETEQE